MQSEAAAADAARSGQQDEAEEKRRNAVQHRRTEAELTVTLAQIEGDINACTVKQQQLQEHADFCSRAAQHLGVQGKDLSNLHAALALLETMPEPSQAAQVCRHCLWSVSAFVAHAVSKGVDTMCTRALMFLLCRCIWPVNAR